MPRLDIRFTPGMDRELPGHLLHAEGVSRARVLNNLRPERGELGRRPGMVATGVTPPTRDGLAGTFPVVHVEELNLEPSIRSRFLVATSREIYIYDEFTDAWDDITPTYTTGTVDVTNGSPTVTGNSTAWRTRGIYGASSPLGNWFKGPDGTWYNIASVDSDTQLTLSANYGGSTLSTQAYTIKRTALLFPDFSGGNPLFLHTWRINQDLYIAGQVSGTFASGLSAQLSDGGVLKIPEAYNLFQTTFTPEYIFSGRSEAEAGIDFAGDSIEIYGLGGLADGRLVLVAQVYDDSTGLTAGARVYYSSHLNVAVWTTSPGGATDLIDYNGAVTGASFSTTSVAIHFNNGIEVAELTGQDDPPLRFRPSRAPGVGAIGPRMIVKVPQAAALPGAELFVGSDLNLYAWNGVSITPVPARGLREELVEAGGERSPLDDKVAVRGGIALLDSRRSEVAFLMTNAVDLASSPTREVRFNYDTGEAWRGTYSGQIVGACVVSHADFGDLPWQHAAPDRNLLLGTDTDSSWLWVTDETVTSDAFDGGEDTGGIYALFEGISFEPELEWCPQEILVFLRAPIHASPAATTLKLRWYSDGIPAGEELTASVTPTRVAYENDALRPEYVAVFKGFSEKPTREGSFVLASNDDNVFAATITRITLFVSEPTADVRAV